MHQPYYWFGSEFANNPLIENYYAALYSIGLCKFYYPNLSEDGMISECDASAESIQSVSSVEIYVNNGVKLFEFSPMDQFIFPTETRRLEARNAILG